MRQKVNTGFYGLALMVNVIPELNGNRVNLLDSFLFLLHLLKFFQSFRNFWKLLETCGLQAPASSCELMQAYASSCHHASSSQLMQALASSCQLMQAHASLKTYFIYIDISTIK